MLIIATSVAAVVGALFGFAASFFFWGVVDTSALGMWGDMRSDQIVERQIVELIEEESATIAVVERVTPAVVSIVVKKPRSAVEYPSYFSPYFAEGAETSQEDALVEVSSGTGFFVGNEGYLLTNRHVVNELGATFFVVTNEGEEIQAELVDIDPFQDIAVMHVEGDGFPSVTLGDSDGIQIGQTVIAIGNTLSEFRNTVTKGVISGINRRVAAGTSLDAEVIDEAIQTDAAINPGNSGGPLINLLGEVIGINTAVSYQGESVGFAIPINEAKRAIGDVQEFGRIVRPWLGVRYLLVAPDREFGIEVDYEIGALIISGEQPGELAIVKDSPADSAGLLENDVIISVNGTQLTQDDALAELIGSFRPGDAVILGVVRDDQLLTFTITLAEYGTTE